MEMQEGLSKLGQAGTKVRNLGILVAVLGILSIAAPQFSGKTLSVVIGVLLILGGIGRTLFSWIAPSWGSAILRAFVGILTVDDANAGDWEGSSRASCSSRSRCCSSMVA